MKSDSENLLIQMNTCLLVKKILLTKNYRKLLLKKIFEFYNIIFFFYKFYNF